MIKEIVDYSQALKEVYLILNNTNLDDVSQIPTDFIRFIEENKDNDYEPNIDFSKPLTEQKLKEETINILSLIYMKYWSSNEGEKESSEDTLIENSEVNVLDEETENNEVIENEIKEEFVPIVVVKRENIFKRMINWIKKRKKTK